MIFMMVIERLWYLQGCTVSLTTVGRVEGLIVKDERGRPLRLTVTSEVLGGTALKVHVQLFIEEGGRGRGWERERVKGREIGGEEQMELRKKRRGGGGRRERERRNGVRRSGS